MKDHNLMGKYVAIHGSDIWHEYEKRTDTENEIGRRQIPFSADTIKEAIMAIYSPDVVENLFTKKQLPTERQSFAYAKKSPSGYYVVVEAVGGRRNPNVVPVMLLQFNEDKWNNMMTPGKTLGEILYENDPERKAALDVAFNKKNRVTVAHPRGRRFPAVYPYHVGEKGRCGHLCHHALGESSSPHRNDGFRLLPKGGRYSQCPLAHEMAHRKI